jgi:hypothetical protein
MRRTRIGITVSIAAVLAWGLVRAQDEASELRAIEKERLRSLVEGDLATAVRLHANDFQLINPAGVALSRDEYLGAIASGELDYLLWEPGTIEVRRYGEATVMRYEAEAQAVAGGQTTPLRRFWHTEVYERRNGSWQVVWSQATLIQ